VAVSIRCVAPGHQQVMTPHIAVCWSFRWLSCGCDVSWREPFIRVMLQHTERTSLAHGRELMLMLLQQDTCLHGVEMATLHLCVQVLSEDGPEMAILHLCMQRLSDDDRR